MREIKFRFWDRDGKEIVNELKGFAYKGINQLFDDFLNTKQFIPMQYTGLKDKNGKEIYEGDIIDFAGLKDKFEIVFKNSGFKTKPDYIRLNAEGIKMFGKVIGNIYENKSEIS